MTLHYFNQKNAGNLSRKIDKYQVAPGYSCNMFLQFVEKSIRWFLVIYHTTLGELMGELPPFSGTAPKYIRLLCVYIYICVLLYEHVYYYMSMQVYHYPIIFYEISTIISHVILFPAHMFLIIAYMIFTWWFQPLWKKWVRQLGWRNSQYIYIYGKSYKIPWFQSPPNSDY